MGETGPAVVLLKGDFMTERLLAHQSVDMMIATFPLNYKKKSVSGPEHSPRDTAVVSAHDQEWLRFLQLREREMKPGSTLHIVMGSYNPSNRLEGLPDRSYALMDNLLKQTMREMSGAGTNGNVARHRFPIGN